MEVKKMKKLLVSLFVLFTVLGISYASIIEFPECVKTDACTLYDTVNGISGIGISAPIVSVGIFDLNIGYANFNNVNSITGSISFDLDNLNKIGVRDITYLWEGLVKTKIAIWMSSGRAGISATVIQLKF